MNITELKRRLGSGLPPKIETFLTTADDRDLLRINLKLLGDRLGQDWRSLRELFLEGVAKGGFSLSWDYHCPHCNAVPGFKHKFGELEPEGACGLCSTKFRNELDKNVEVTFGLVADIHQIPETVAAAVRDEMFAAYQAGTLAMPAAWLSGLDVITSPAFHELFGDDVLSSEESLSIERVCFLFTDIKGSTQMYSDLGDTASYRIVRDHFKILFKEVEANGGVIVKTIGDAIMAAFPKTEQALETSIRAFQAFRERQWESVGHIQIKMGIHSGPAIVVTLNDRLDYFGNTVNLAARIQGIAEDHSVCISASAVADPGARGKLSAWHQNHPGSVRHFMKALKGIKGQIEVYSLQ
jgi:class 3 adenylate cyclase